MTFNKKLILIVLFLVVMSFNVSAAVKTIKGTKYTTTYDPAKLGKMFNGFFEATTYKQGKILKTGEIVLIENITSTRNEKRCLHHSTIGNVVFRYKMVNNVNTFQSCDLMIYYGTVGGKLKIINKTAMEVMSTNPKKPVYWQYFIKDKKLQIQSITNNKVMIFKKFDISISSEEGDPVDVYSNGGVYFQNKVVVCAPGSNCKFHIQALYKTVNVREEALAMSMNTYRNKYKGKSAAARSRLKLWEVLNITDFIGLYFYPDTKYKLSGNFQGNSGNMEFKLRGYLLHDFSVLGKLEPKKMLPDTNKIDFGIIKPIGTSSQPVYFLAPGELSNLWVETLEEYAMKTETRIPDNTYLILEIGNLGGSLKIPTSKQPMVSFPYATILAVQKKDNSLSGSFFCPQFFRGYHCLMIDHAKQRVYLKPTKGQVFSPFKNKKVNNSLKISMVGFDYFNVTISPFLAKDDYVALSTYFKKDRYTPTVSVGAIPQIGISQKKLTFPVTKKWYDVGYTFVAKFLTDKPNVYDFILCDHKQKKCYINGVEMSKALKKGKQCRFKKGGSAYIYLPCSKLPECRELTPGSSKKAIRVLFIGNKYNSEADLKKEVQDIVFGSKGFGSISPFSNNMNQLGIFYANLKNKYPMTDKKPYPEEFLKEATQKCPGMTVTFFLHPVDTFQRSFAPANKVMLFVYKASNLKEMNRRVATHEFGHAFASLADEYLNHVKGDTGNPEKYLRNNCVAGKNKADAKRKAITLWTNILGTSRQALPLANKADTSGWWGCGGDCDTKICGHYLRQQEKSIMNNPREPPYKWGPISSAILTQRIDALSMAWKKYLEEKPMRKYFLDTGPDEDTDGDFDD